ncbi:MAG: SDR family NAD(P)-dependent oxidoreductase [Gemmatimonadales bacterium]
MRGVGLFQQSGLLTALRYYQSGGDYVASILVTGASRGIGRATCGSLGRAGHRGLATMRDPSGAPELSAIASAESLPIIVSAMDVDSDESVRRGVGDIVAQRGPVDVLVNNAGIERRGSVEELAIGELRAVLETNRSARLRRLFSLGVLR